MINAVSTTSIPQAHDQAMAKVVLIKLYHLRFLIQCGGMRNDIIAVLIGGEVIPQDLVWREGGEARRAVRCRHNI